MIDSDYNYQELRLIKQLIAKNSPFIPKISDLLNYIKPLLNSRIPAVFPHYTLHDVGHSFRVIDYMGKIVTDIEALNELEIVLLIYSAFLHDIGMALDEEDIKLIKTDKFEYSDIKYSVLKRINNYNDTVALQEFTRRIHSRLSAKYILQNPDLFTLPLPNPQTVNFSKELAAICESHTEDIDWIKQKLTTHEVRGSYSFNSQFIAGILRLADILDIDGSRTPYVLYKAIAPQNISDKEWKQHFVISNTEKIEINNKTNIKTISFYGHSDNPTIHRKLLNYFDWVNSELNKVSALVNNLPEQYNIRFESTVSNNLQTQNFTYSDYKITLDFKAISSLLMGEKIYGDKTLGLRELVQNSIDACRLRQEKISDTQAFGEETYRGHIKVILSKSNNYVKVKDNGLGMSLNVIKKHFLNIGVSYYKSEDFKLNDFKYQPIGNFGIGFLSAFMLSSYVKVTTRPMNSDIMYLIDLEKGSEYISLTNVKDYTFDGTEIIMNYDEFMNVFNQKEELIEEFLSKYFLTDGIEFTILDMDKEVRKPVINLLKKSEVLDESTFKINLDIRSEGIEGYAIIKIKRNFIKSFSDLIFDGDLYTYNPKNQTLERVLNSTNLLIDDFIINREIKYLSIPLVPSSLESSFMNGLEYTNNEVDEVISNFSYDLNWISILFPKDLVNSFEEKEISEDDFIISDLSTYRLRQLGHSRDCTTKVYIKSIDLYESRKNNLYVPFYEPYPYQYLYTNDLRSRQQRRLYLRSVLIKDFLFYFPTMANIFDIRELVVNISSRKYIPDISRNNLDIESSKEISYIISKTIHEEISKLGILDYEERDAMLGFINNYYSR